MILNDLRYAIRGLFRAPGFAIAAIITLAIGIGANTAIVGVIDAALFAPLPFGDADRLVAMRGSFRSRPPTSGVTSADLVDYRARAKSLLFEVQPYDPTILAGMIAMLTVVSLAASFIPARRATRIDPARLLRAE